jgi:hypothetical protein
VSSEEQRAVFEHLSSIDRTSFDQSWEKLSEIAYRRSRTVTVRDEHDSLIGRMKQDAVVSGPPGARVLRVERQDSSGSFERSLWSRFSGDHSDVDDPSWASMVLPADPLFLAPQGPGFFQYAALEDTLIDGVPVDKYAVSVRPETSRQGLQRATLYLVDSTLVGVETLFSQQSLLFQEVSNFKVWLSPGTRESWLPVRAAASSTIGFPFARSRTYLIDTQYEPVTE